MPTFSASPPRSLLSVAALLLVPGLAALPAAADTDPWEPILPPETAWTGESRELLAGPEDPWITPAEVAGFRTTPSANETRAWLERLAGESPRIRLETIGTSGAGRDLLLVVAGREGASLDELRGAADRSPVVLAQAGIHAGEIDGKDAGLMLLRDLAFGHLADGDLLDRVTFLLVPILNVDGHERVEAYSRINQRGPENAGWRTDSRNRNLNRDWAKADTPEVRAVLRLLREWDPELWLDLHVTDGSDYLYDVTWGHVGPQTWSPAIGAWLETRFDVAVAADLRETGHDPGPLVFAADWNDPTKGLQAWEAPPRFSDGYGDLRHTPTVLVENHSLDSYERRVLGTRVFLEATLELVAAEGGALREAIDADRRLRPDEVVLGWTRADEPTMETLEFRAVESRRVESAIGGDEQLEWTGRPAVGPTTLVIPDVPTAAVSRPAAYWIPSQWTEVLEVLGAHGIRTSTTETPTTIEAERLWLEDAKLEPMPFEGRVRATASVRVERGTETLPAGTVRVGTDQPLGDLAVHLLEPAAVDSLFQWGFFHGVLQRTEYFEEYVLDPVVERMLAADDDLRREWDAALEDPELAADPRARRFWWYERSPWLDPQWKLYPVRREPANPEETNR